MSIIDTLVTDRTLNDLDKLNAKGTYNWTDMNRVGSALNYLATLLNSYGYAVTLTDVKTNWAKNDDPTPEQLNQYLANLRTIRTVLTLPASTPALPQRIQATSTEAKDGLNIEGANNIEKMLVSIEDTVNRMVAAWFYSGEIYCGEVI